jgi:hypothetical protein
MRKNVLILFCLKIGLSTIEMVESPIFQQKSIKKIQPRPIKQRKTLLSFSKTREKMSSGQMSLRANVFRANVIRANVTPGKCLPGKRHPGKCHSGKMSLRAIVFRANVVRANVTPGKYLRANVFRANVFRANVIEPYSYTALYINNFNLSTLSCTDDDETVSNKSDQYDNAFEMIIIDI